jgi:hypothetical protein
VPVDILVLHQGDDLSRVLVDVNDQFQLFLDPVLHEVTSVLRVSILTLDVINQFVKSQPYSQRVDVLPEDTVLCRLAENFLKDLHHFFSLILFHEWLEPLDKSYLDLIL